MDRELGEQIFFRGHPSWLSMTRLVIKGMLGGLVLGVVAGIASTVSSGHVEVVWVVLGVLVATAACFLVGQTRRMRTTYSITSRRLAIETGLLSRDVHQTRLERVQNVNARQSLLERALGIGTVDFDTADELGFDFCFRGVDDPRAIAAHVDWAMQHAERDWGAPVAYL